jgi:hypothetical protein
MQDLTTLIQERAEKGKLNSLSLIASAAGPGKRQSVFKAAYRAPDGTLSTGEDADAVSALLIALRGTNAGINKTKKRSAARPEQSGDENFDFG